MSHFRFQSVQTGRGAEQDRQQQAASLRFPIYRAGRFALVSLHVRPFSAGSGTPLATQPRRPSMSNPAGVLLVDRLHRPVSGSRSRPEPRADRLQAGRS